MIYLVMGMHKSGTSLVAETLHKSGINMLSPADELFVDKNKYENNEASSVNKRLLNCWGAYSLDVVPSSLDSSLDGHAIDEFIDLYDSQFKEWGFKDPRMCFTYPVWKDRLPKHKIIFVFRDPSEVTQHYLKLAWKRKNWKRLLKFRQPVNSWMLHNNKAISYLPTDGGNVFYLHYGSYMLSGSTIHSRLEEFVGRKLVDCRDDKKYRSRNNFLTASLVSTKALTVYRMLLRRALLDVMLVKKG